MENLRLDIFLAKRFQYRSRSEWQKSLQDGEILVNGKKAKYVGNICMDVCMIDVTDIDCKEGDSVEIFGSNLPIYRLAEWLDTIPYEVLTSVSTRIKRVYYCD